MLPKYVAGKCNFLEIMTDLQTNRPINQSSRPTDQTDMRGHIREVTLPIIQRLLGEHKLKNIWIEWFTKWWWGTKHSFFCEALWGGRGAGIWCGAQYLRYTPVSAPVRTLAILVLPKLELTFWERIYIFFWMFTLALQGRDMDLTSWNIRVFRQTWRPQQERGSII